MNTENEMKYPAMRKEQTKRSLPCRSAIAKAHGRRAGIPCFSSVRSANILRYARFWQKRGKR